MRTLAGDMAVPPRGEFAKARRAAAEISAQTKADVRTSITEIREASETLHEFVAALEGEPVAIVAQSPEISAKIRI